MNDIVDTLSFWGSLASIIALVLVIVPIIYAKVNSIKESTKKQKERYQDIKAEMTEFTAKGTSYQKRQDIFIYANSMLAQGRHLELRTRITTSIAVFMGLPFILYGLYGALDSFHVNYQVFGFDIPWLSIGFILGILMILSGYVSFIRILSNISKTNDSYSEGFLEQIEQSIKKKYDDHTPNE